ncbi:MAG: helix-hairpin-helix domain-containing protein [Burkholderiaceae bacterium]|nr:helix-hairpin-helix domain-containing protein [Burkholderiaceae bacterium]
MFRLLIATLLAAFAFAAQASVDVNKASQAELETIKGIGPALSTKILDARKAGDFKSWADMVDRVAGVGPGNAARFSQAGLTVGSASYSAPTAASKAPAPKAAAPAKPAAPR